MIALRPYTDDDLWLSLALETDPVAMAELGGPRSEDAIRRVHPTRADGLWSYVIEEDGEALGSIFVWPSDGAHEIGWMVLPKAHGRGVASAGLRLLLERVDADERIGDLHAFPGTTNAASNRLCASAGFEDRGATEVDFGDAHLRCRHWIRPASR